MTSSRRIIPRRVQEFYKNGAEVPEKRCRNALRVVAEKMVTRESYLETTPGRCFVQDFIKFAPIAAAEPCFINLNVSIV
jgi:hypothetical protein